MSSNRRLRWLVDADQNDFAELVASLSDMERDEFAYHWGLFGRADQMPPPGDWRIWLVCAGRGFGKTRAGAEWVRQIARTNPDARIALVGASLSEVRSIMVEGESGILAVTPPEHMPDFEPSLKRLTWRNGAQAYFFSAAEPEGLRGPQHSHAWCDEIAKWDNSAERATRAWDNLMMGLRLGDAQQAMATTTPRVVALLQKLMDESDDGVVITRGSTYDNAANLPREFIAHMDRSFGGSALGRQELDGVLLRDIEGALWSRSLLEKCRAPADNAPLSRIVIGVDPPASATGDACGIVVCGLTEDRTARVLADCSVEKASPEKWARSVANSAAQWNADRIIAEANQGGAMVESVLRAAEIALPVKLVHASRGKVARAEPVAALYEAGRVNHAGSFPRLEDEMCGLMTGGAYAGPGRSPDRADALVWALHELMLGNLGSPQVRRL